MVLSRKEASAPVVYSVDTRGDDTGHFGFVYFRDECRVCFAELPDAPSDKKVFAVEWRGGTATPAHVAAARRYLVGLGYKV